MRGTLVPILNPLAQSHPRTLYNRVTLLISGDLNQMRKQTFTTTDTLYKPFRVKMSFNKLAECMLGFVCFFKLQYVLIMFLTPR